MPVKIKKDSENTHFNSRIFIESRMLVEMNRNKLKEFGVMPLGKGVPIGPRGITAKELDKGMDEFQKRYRISPAHGPIVEKIEISWNEFQGTIDDAITTSGFSEDKLALRFKHRYSNANGWFICMECCQLTNTVSSATPENGVVAVGNKWDFVDGSPAVESSLSTDFDSYYRDNISYEKVSPLNFDDNEIPMHVGSIIIPWLNEIKQAFIDNGLDTEEVDQELIKIAIAGYSVEVKKIGYQGVAWPHGLVFYFIYDGIPLLDNTNTVVIYYNKGADFGTLCPPEYYNVYVWPY